MNWATSWSASVGSFRMGNNGAAAVDGHVHHVSARLLVFFPSYAAMSVLIQRWQASALIGRLEMHKRVIVEPKSSSELAVILVLRWLDRASSRGQGCLAAYREAIESGQGAMLFAVCRGKVSEGVDFSDRAARGKERQSTVLAGSTGTLTSTRCDCMWTAIRRHTLRSCSAQTLVLGCQRWQRIG